MSQKDEKVWRKLTFNISEFKFQNGLMQKKLGFCAFLRQTGLSESNAQKSVEILMQILNLLSDTEILAPELVSDESEMVVL